MTAADAPGPVRGQGGDQDSASRRDAGSPGPFPAVIAHLTAICRSRQDLGMTADVQATAPGRYVITICGRRRELSLTFTRRRRGWDLAGIELTQDGVPLDAARSIYQVLRLLSDHEIGTGTPSPTGAARLPRDSALETRKNTVLRV